MVIPVSPQSDVSGSFEGIVNLEFQQDYSEQATEVYTAALRDKFWGHTFLCS